MTDDFIKRLREQRGKRDDDLNKADNPKYVEAFRNANPPLRTMSPDDAAFLASGQKGVTTKDMYGLLEQLATTPLTPLPVRRDEPTAEAPATEQPGLTTDEFFEAVKEGPFLKPLPVKRTDR